jgi:glycosyltransferase involved in cell wall biosynthesis
MISIITPIFNTPEKYLRKYLNSLEKIDKKLIFEVVFINDGGQIPDINFSDWDFDISFYSYETNRGPGYARQYGINKAKYEYIMFCDSDDCILPGGFQEIYNEIISIKPEIF